MCFLTDLLPEDEDLCFSLSGEKGMGACIWAGCLLRGLSAAGEPDLACAFADGAQPGYCLLTGT